MGSDRFSFSPFLFGDFFSFSCTIRYLMCIELDAGGLDVIIVFLGLQRGSACSRLLRVTECGAEECQPKLGVNMPWRLDFLALTGLTPDRIAQLRNLDTQYYARIAVVGFCVQVLDTIYARMLAAPGVSSDAPLFALDEAAESLGDPTSPWLGQDPIGPGPHPGIPSEVRTHVRLDTIVKDRLAGDVLDPSVVDSFPLAVPLKYSRENDGSLRMRRRFIWVTWSTPDKELPLDPVQLLRDLGMRSETQASNPSTQADDNKVYSITLQVETLVQSAYRPTVLDAEICPYWAPVPESYTDPWGLTRNHQTGKRPFPELLVESKDYEHVSLHAEVLPRAISVT
jgi:hypothetical protein